MENFDFAITHANEPEEILKNVSIPAESEEVAKGFAEGELEEYKKGLEINPEKFA